MKKTMLLQALFLLACAKTETPAPTPAPNPAPTSSVRSWVVGDTADVSPKTEALIVLMGGSAEVDEAMRLMIKKSGGGDFVILRATGTDGYNNYLFRELGGVNSVETFLVNSREKAQDKEFLRKVRNAEAIFIAGGDQADYVRFWKDTPLEDALNELIKVKKIPIGGTSAGCAIQGKVYFSALRNTIRSEQALANPFDENITLGKDDFLDHSILANLITDTHYDNPDRKGRHSVFLARIQKDWQVKPKGIGVDERTAVVIEGEQAKVLGTGKAYFLQTESQPEVLENAKAVTWDNNGKAIQVYEVQAALNYDNAPFLNLKDWKEGRGGVWKYFAIKEGILRETQQ